LVAKLDVLAGFLMESYVHSAADNKEHIPTVVSLQHDVVSGIEPRAVAALSNCGAILSVEITEEIDRE
jgi:hypothetical protein